MSNQTCGGVCIYTRMDLQIKTLGVSQFCIKKTVNYAQFKLSRDQIIFLSYEF